MSYQLIGENTRKAAKDHRCVWCGQKIPKGTSHVHERSKYDGDFQNHRWHGECIDAMREYGRKTGDWEFEYHGNPRGGEPE